MVDKQFIEDSVKKVFEKRQENNVNNSGSGSGSGSFAQQLKQKYSFHNIHNSIISGLMKTIIVWILSCFKKYSEKEFHDKMSQNFMYTDKLTGGVYPMVGFDFINDWQQNHKNTFGKIIPTIRKFNITLNKEELLGLSVGAIRKQGWTITEQEIKCLRFTITRLINILYYNVDTINR